MKDEPASIVIRTERTIDDLRGLCKRRKPLCVVVCLVILLPTILWFFDHFWGRASLQSELSETKRDRDAKATQLAPFQALANLRYENAPEGKRLELLVDRLEALTQSLLRIAGPPASQAPKKRALSPDAVKQIQGKLDFAKAVPISITTPVGVDETNELAHQLRALFEASGFHVESAIGMFERQPVGLMVRAQAPLPPELEDALLAVFKELGESPQFYQAPEIKDSRVAIIVGARPSPPPSPEPNTSGSPTAVLPQASSTPWLTIETLKKPK